MSESGRILVIEDDRNLASGLAYNLERAGYRCVCAGDGAGGLAELAKGIFDLVILDLMLPGLGGFEVLEKLRSRGDTVPVVILSARDAEVDKVRGFGLGAVDYVTKPFGIGELLARIKVRIGDRGSTPKTPERLRFEAGTVDLAGMTLTTADGSVALTPLEVEILRKLREGAGAPVDRETLSRSIWGLGAGATRTLDTHIARLRKKIELDPAHPRHLVTVHGVGYRLFESPND